MKVEWSPLALERVQEIAEFIAQDNPQAAERWVIDLFDSVKRLADFPKSGRMVPEIGVERIREIIFEGCRVIHCVDDRVKILTVRDGRQMLRTEELIDESND